MNRAAGSNCGDVRTITAVRQSLTRTVPHAPNGPPVVHQPVRASRPKMANSDMPRPDMPRPDMASPDMASPDMTGPNEAGNHMASLIITGVVSYPQTIPIGAGAMVWQGPALPVLCRIDDTDGNPLLFKKEGPDAKRAGAYEVPARRVWDALLT